MHSKKLVTALPLESIWKSEAEIQAFKESYLVSTDIVELLKTSSVQFVVADVGKQLNWIDEKQTFNFWKAEVKQHLAEDVNGIFLDRFPGNYAYVASRWETEEGPSIILLEMYH